MVNQELLEIVIKAIDQASETTKKVSDNVTKIGDAAKASEQKTSQSAKLTQQQMNNLAHKISGVVKSTDQVGAKGASQFKRYNQSVQDSIVKFNMLDKETQEMLRYLSQMSAKGREAFLAMSSKAQEAVSKFNALDNVTHTWGGTLDYTKTKMQLLGTNTDSLKGKIQVVGTAVTTHLGNKWDSLKSKVSGFGNFIKSNLSNSLSIVGNKINNLGNAFSGLGGIISTAIGGLGMASIGQLTVGLAMNRDRMTSLTSAVMGGQQAGEKFVGTMDRLTNDSLVSLDTLGQAMSTIKMSTGMSNAELEKFTETVNDVGQRAILMGKSGDEALSLMQAAGRGLNGEFDMLKTNFGITKEKLENLGWSGAADDVEGYQKALKKALEAGGSMDGMMDTTTGKLETLKKNFRVAGRHVGEMFTPYINQALDMLNNLSNSCPGLFENLVMIAGGISLFATVAPSIAPVFSTFQSLMDIGSSTFDLFKTGAKGLQAFHTALSAGEGIRAAATAGFNAMGASELFALWPLALIVAALIAVGIAIYEVGKYFGWWTDFGSMIDAIWAGIQRLWAAFINHPDVQAFIEGLTQAWNALSSALGPVVSAIAEFFGIQMDGNFDIIAAWINNVGNAWAVLTSPIKTVVIYIEEMIGAFYRVITGQQDVQTAFAEAWQNIITRVWPIMNQLIQILGPFVQAFISAAIRAGAGFVRNILIYIATLPGRIGAYLLMVNVRIIMAMVKWITTAVARARQFVLRILTIIRTLPGLFLAALLRVVSAIVSAGHRWVQSAAAAARSVVTNVINRIRSLPGDVASALSGVAGAFVRPFQDAWNRIQPILDSIKNGIAQIAGAAGGDAAGGDIPMAAGGDSDVSSLIGGNGEYTVEHDENITVDENITLTFDLKNVPGHIDERTLISMLNDKKVIKSIVENREFQRLDQKVKDRILAKTRRARGV